MKIEIIRDSRILKAICKRWGMEYDREYKYITNDNNIQTYQVLEYKGESYKLIFVSGCFYPYISKKIPQTWEQVEARNKDKSVYELLELERESTFNTNTIVLYFDRIRGAYTMDSSFTTYNEAFLNNGYKSCIMGKLQYLFENVKPQEKTDTVWTEEGKEILEIYNTCKRCVSCTYCQATNRDCKINDIIKKGNAQGENKKVS